MSEFQQYPGNGANNFNGNAPYQPPNNGNNIVKIMLIISGSVVALAVLAIVAFFVYSANIGGEGYYKDASVNNLPLCVLGAAAALAVVNAVLRRAAAAPGSRGTAVGGFRISPRLNRVCVNVDARFGLSADELCELVGARDEIALVY